jgi:hypothetical protein
MHRFRARHLRSPIPPEQSPGLWGVRIDLAGLYGIQEPADGIPSFGLSLTVWFGRGHRHHHGSGDH